MELFVFPCATLHYSSELEQYEKNQFEANNGQ